MENKVIKIGVVGMGRGIDLALAVDGKKAVVRAICDIRPEAIAVGKKYLLDRKRVKEEDLLCFESYEEMLKSDIDAVVVATAPALHTPMAIQAMEAGKHVISEIPTVNSLEDARKLKDAVKAHPELIYMAGENCCYWAFINSWKSIYEKGLLGPAVFAESEYLHHEYNPDNVGRRSIDKDGNPTWRYYLNAIEYLTHNLGPLLYILDDRCVNVTCFSPDFNYRPDTIPGCKPGVKDQVAIFKTAKGAIIKIFIGFGTNVGMDHNFTIYGVKGTLETDRNTDIFAAHTFARLADFPYTEGKIEIPVSLGYPDYERPRQNTGSHGGADPKMMEAFVDAIRNGTKSPLDVDAGIHMSLAGRYALESAQKGSITIEIPEFL